MSRSKGAAGVVLLWSLNFVVLSGVYLLGGLRRLGVRIFGYQNDDNHLLITLMKSYLTYGHFRPLLFYNQDFGDNGRKKITSFRSRRFADFSASLFSESLTLAAVSSRVGDAL